MSMREDEHSHAKQNPFALPDWTRLCPVCQSRALRPALEKILWDKPKQTFNLRCDNCRALFKRRGLLWELTAVKNQTRQVWIKYHNLPLSPEQWKAIAYETELDK